MTSNMAARQAVHWNQEPYDWLQWFLSRKRLLINYQFGQKHLYLRCSYYIRRSFIAAKINYFIHAYKLLGADAIVLQTNDIENLIYKLCFMLYGLRYMMREKGGFYF